MRSVRLLVERGADVNRGDGNGATALHNKAILMGHVAVVRLLRDAGATE